MIVERNLLISLLKLTKNKSVLIESVNSDARIPSKVTWKLLEKLQDEGLIYIKNDWVELDSADRIKLAVKAASLGADVENISKLLCWQEFEELAAIALKNNNYIVQKNLRFTHEKKRWEIDVVGCKKPLVICIDCKHWQRAISSSTLRRIIKSQSKRTLALADSLPNSKLKIECTKWDNAKFIPSVLSLIPSQNKFVDNVPVVPVLQLQDFICHLPAFTDSLKFFSKTIQRLSQDFEN
jgi:Holliday junction resolvase-like predicted endonuclease